MDKLFWIEEGRLAGRCGPSVTPLDMEVMKRAGFRHILSLDAKEYALVQGSHEGVEVDLIHLPNSVPPLPLEIKIYETRLPEAIDYVVEKISTPGKGSVLVHCHAGNDRTGGVLTGYLSRTRGIPLRAALRQVRKANPDAISAEGYEEMILAVLEKTGASS